MLWAECETNLDLQFFYVYDLASFTVGASQDSLATPVLVYCVDGSH